MVVLAASLAIWRIHPAEKEEVLRRVAADKPQLGPVLGLDQYHVVLEGVVLPRIKENLSGLTYNHERHTLFGIINAPASLAEISLDGRLLQLSRLRGFKDTEGVAFLGDNRFAVVEEHKLSIRIASIDQRGKVVPRSTGPPYALGQFLEKNAGLEGIGYDYDQGIYVVKEYVPAVCYRVDGLAMASGKPAGAIKLTVPFEADPLGLEDLAGIECDYGTGNLLILSQISKRALEVTKNGKVLSSIHLVQGKHGLSRTVPQPEGIATDRNGRLYIASEPNLLYVFARSNMASRVWQDAAMFTGPMEPRLDAALTRW